MEDYTGNTEEEEREKNDHNVNPYRGTRELVHRDLPEGGRVEKRKISLK